MWLAVSSALPLSCLGRRPEAPVRGFDVGGAAMVMARAIGGLLCLLGSLIAGAALAQSNDVAARHEMVRIIEVQVAMLSAETGIEKVDPRVLEVMREVPGTPSCRAAARLCLWRPPAAGEPRAEHRRAAPGRADDPSRRRRSGRCGVRDRDRRRLPGGAAVRPRGRSVQRRGGGDPGRPGGAVAQGSGLQQRPCPGGRRLFRLGRARAL